MENHCESLIQSNGFVIGEPACGHEGEIGNLKLLIDIAARAHADAIKFQIFTPPERATKDHPEWELFNRLALSEGDWHAGAEYAREKKLNVFADIFGDESFEIANAIGVDGFKIHSEDLLNTFFIEKIAKEGKVLMIGVGGAHRIEIYQLLQYLASKSLIGQTYLTTGVQTFPTPLEAHSVLEVVDLKEKYGPMGVKIIFSDHIAGDMEDTFLLPIMALGAGAVAIEKHFTFNRDDKWEDYESALGRDEFADFVTNIKRLAPLMAPITLQTEQEKKYRKTFKKSPVVNQGMPAGHVLAPQDILYVKHAKHSVPLSSLNLVGRKLKKNLKEGEILRNVHIDSKVGGIIVARCTSNRLPYKATRKIVGRETIALVVERIKRCRNLDCIILATSDNPEDDIIETIGKREGVLTFRGDLNNVSERFYQAAKFYELDHIVRITGDDILRDEVMIDKIVESHLYNSCDVSMTENMPYGTHSDVFSFEVIKTIMNYANDHILTEYLEWYLENDRYFSVNHVKSPYVFDPSLRITLDYEEDLKFFEQIFNHFYLKNPCLTLDDVLKWIEENPKVKEVNKAEKIKNMSEFYKQKPAGKAKSLIDVSINI